MLHVDRVRSKKCSETEPKRCWTGSVQMRTWTCTYNEVVNTDIDDGSTVFARVSIIAVCTRFVYLCVTETGAD